MRIDKADGEELGADENQQVNIKPTLGAGQGAQRQRQEERLEIVSKKKNIENLYRKK